PRRAFFLMLISLSAMIYFGSKLPSELAPMEDKGRMMVMTAAPEGTSFDRMDAYQQELIQLVDTLPELDNLLSVTSPGFGASISTNRAFLRLNRVEKNQRTKSQSELADEITAQLGNYGFARAFVTQEQTIGGGRMSGLPVQYVIQAPTFEKLEE